MSDKKKRGSALPHSEQNVASGTEQTGLMPTPPIDDSENKAYNEIYQMPGKSSKPQNKKGR